jgi:hypothetical protein
MIWIGRGAGTLVFLFSLLLGAAALIIPDRAALQLGFAPLSDMGRNSLRADIVALAWTSAILCAGGLFSGRGHWFLGAATIFGIAVSGRILDVIVSGAPDGVVRPIIIELLLVACALIAARLLPSK